MMYRGIKSVLIKFRQMLLEDEYRIGKLYTTLDPNDNPSSHLPGTWERLPDGVFIRNAGGDAGTVGEVQKEGIPNIKGSLNVQSNSGSNRAFYTNWSGGGGVTGGTYTQSVWMDFNAANGEVKVDGTFKNDVFGKSDHVTPVNIAVYMWVRTA